MDTNHREKSQKPPSLPVPKMTNDEDGMSKRIVTSKKSAKNPLFWPKIALFRSRKAAEKDLLE